VYPGAQHGFECDQRATYQAHAARVALSRTLRFFFEQLG
jgi:carboxymethylenebutenolidase